MNRCAYKEVCTGVKEELKTNRFPIIENFAQIASKFLQKESGNNQFIMKIKSGILAGSNIFHKHRHSKK